MSHSSTRVVKKEGDYSLFPKQAQIAHGYTRMKRVLTDFLSLSAYIRMIRVDPCSIMKTTPTRADGRTTLACHTFPTKKCHTFPTTNVILSLQTNHTICGKIVFVQTGIQGMHQDGFLPGCALAKGGLSKGTKGRCPCKRKGWRLAVCQQGDHNGTQVPERTSPAWPAPPGLGAPGGGAPRAASLYHNLQTLSPLHRGRALTSNARA